MRMVVQSRWFKKGIAKQTPRRTPRGYWKCVMPPGGKAVWISLRQRYVCVNEIGDLIKPHYVTESFRKLLRTNELREIRFHDLRHSCASLMLANGVPMKQIQDWLGHSDFSTTANIYAHLDYNSKISSADAMLNGLGLAAQ